MVTITTGIHAYVVMHQCHNFEFRYDYDIDTILTWIALIAHSTIFDKDARKFSNDAYRQCLIILLMV